MKKGIAATMILSCMVCAANTSDAGQLKTDFAFRVHIGSTVYNDTPSADGTCDTLPSDMSAWCCKVTLGFLSSDGKTIYHNMVCSDRSTDTAVGTTISCPTHSEGKDDGSFWIRAGSSSVQYDGVCSTHQVGGSTQSVQGTTL